MHLDDLRPLELFDGLADKELLALIDLGADVRFAPGEELFREGAPAEFWWVLVEGRVDLVRHVAMVRGVPVSLTRSEFQLLRLLVGRPGEVFPRRQIMEELWQTEFDGDERACDVHISNLRQKVERDPQNPELVLTVRGVGYKFNGESD